MANADAYLLGRLNWLERMDVLVRVQLVLADPREPGLVEPLEIGLWEPLETGLFDPLEFGLVPVHPSLVFHIFLTTLELAFLCQTPT